MPIAFENFEKKQHTHGLTLLKCQMITLLGKVGYLVSTLEQLTFSKLLFFQTKIMHAGV